MMQVIFRKVSHERNDLVIVREDGSREEALGLESRSMFRHDLMHYVVEKQAGLRESFYGSLASGKSFDAMRPPARLDSMESHTNPAGEGGTTELIVALLQGAHKEDFDGTELLARMPEYFSVQGATVPSYVTVPFVEAAVKEFRFLVRTYEGLRTGESLTLEF